MSCCPMLIFSCISYTWMYLQLITEDEEWANFSDDGNEDEEDGEGPEEEDDDGKIQTMLNDSFGNLWIS